MFIRSPDNKFIIDPNFSKSITWHINVRSYILRHERMRLNKNGLFLRISSLLHTDYTTQWGKFGLETMELGYLDAQNNLILPLLRV